MLNQKEKRLLHYLIERKNQYSTSKEVATYLACSDRTARTYLKSLIDSLQEEDGFEIISKPSLGYKIHIVDQEVFYSFLRNYHLVNSPFHRELDIEDRQKYILNKLLFEQVDIYFDDLVEELFVSRSTLSSDFKKIRRDLERYRLQVESKASHGVFVTGSERDKRRFIMDYFFRDQFFKTMHLYVQDSLFGEDIPIEEITLIVLEECREGGLRLSDFVIQNLVVHIALVIQRIQKGFEIAAFSTPFVGDCQREQRIARNILNRLSSSIQVHFPKSELDYITLHLISKSYHQKGVGIKEDIGDSIRTQLVDVLTELVLCEYPFHEDFQLLEGVTTHLLTLLIRLNNHVVLDNPLLEDIKGQYRAIFDMTQKILQLLPLFKDKEISDGEIAYVTLHFLASIERLKEKNKLSILVICATGYGSAQMLKNRLETEFGHQLHIVDVLGYYDLNHQSLKGIDFIVSSIELSTLVFSIPVYTVSIFLNSEEVRMIRNEIRKMSSAPFATSLTPTEGKDATKELAFYFSDYFSEEYFHICLSSDRDELLDTLLREMGRTEEPFYSEKMVQLIEQREELSTLLFSEDMAVPHPLRPISKKHKIGVALAPNGIRWSADYPNVRLVFLVSPSVYENEGLPLLTSRIVEIVDAVDVKSRLVESNSFEEFREYFLTK